MNKIVLISLLTLLLISCKKETETGNNNINHELNDNDFKFSNPITIEFINEINGYKVRAIWLIERFDSKYTEKFIGPAILTFTDTKTNNIQNINHDEFSIDILPENLKYIKKTDVDGIEEYKSNVSFTQKMKYQFPEIVVEEYNSEITSKDRNSGYNEFLPFFFKDVNFDNQPDLILTFATFSEKGGFANEVFISNEYEGFLKTYEDVYKNFHNFYSHAAQDSGSYSKTSIDYKTKRIFYNWMYGCCMHGEDIYEYDKNYGGINLVSKTEYDGISEDNTVVTITDKNGNVTKKTIVN